MAKPGTDIPFITGRDATTKRRTKKITGPVATLEIIVMPIDISKTDTRIIRAIPTISADKRKMIQ